MNATTENFSRYLEAQLALSEHTCVSYCLAMRDFEKWLGKPAVMARRAEIYNYLADRMNTHSPRSVAHRLSVLRHFFAFATDEGFIREDPTQDLRAGQNKSTSYRKAHSAP